MTDTRRHITRVAILGGGITGLTAAYALGRARQGGTPIDEFLLEAGKRPGGLIQTEAADGFTLESGPDSFLTAKSEASALCSELGLAQSLIGSNDTERRTFILHRGRLEPLPDGLMFFVPTRLAPALGSRLISVGSKLALVRDFFRRAAPRRAATTDESIAAFACRHFGPGIVETIVDPLITGVYGGNAEQLSARSLLPRLVAAERESGSVVRGLLRSNQRRPSAAPLFMTLKGGMGELTAALEACINASGPRIFTGQRIESIEPPSGSAPHSYVIRCHGGRNYEAEAVICALPATEAGRLLTPFCRAAGRALSGIPYAPAVIVYLAYSRLPGATPQGFGFLCPAKERREVLACTFVHAKFAHRAPAGSALFRCFLGGARHPDALSWTDDELIAAAKGDLISILGMKDEPVFSRIYRWPAAMPQYVVGHEQQIHEIESAVSGHPGLFLAGSAYRGVGVPDCIRSARQAAERACEFSVNS